MDPNETLRRFLEAYNDADIDIARDAYEDLDAWLAADGFEPDWTEAQKKVFTDFEF